MGLFGNNSQTSTTINAPWKGAQPYLTQAMKAGQKLFTLEVPPAYLNEAKVALTRAGHKLPTPIQITVDSGQELIK